jgi:hypothetical protein
MIKNSEMNLTKEYVLSELMFFDKNVKLNRNSIAKTENISIVFQLFLS